MQLSRRDMMLGAMGAALVSGRAVAREKFTIGGPAFGSSWRATFSSSADAEAANQSIRNIIAEIDLPMSPYRADSDLSRFNASENSDWQSVEPSMCTVVREALHVAAMTDGFFDPSVGPLVARHGFGPISGGEAPLTGFEVGKNSLRKETADATLDLCGLAKGYALDQIKISLRSEGIRSAIVDVGGEVLVLGSRPSGRPWSVAIVDPKSSGSARHIVALRGVALATSGHAVNGVRGRVNTSHIMDPHQRAPAKPALLSVSVIDRSAMRADALATAFCAAGPVAGPALARRLNSPALFLGDGDLKQVLTGDFGNFISI